MKKFWKKGEQPQLRSPDTVVASTFPIGSAKAKAVSPTKAVRKAACWGGSSAVGEAEVVASPTPTHDTIKANIGTKQLVQVLSLCSALSLIAESPLQV